MKIITENAIYVQMNDIAYLNSTNIIIPLSIYIKVFGKGITVIDDNNRYDFIKFENKHEIDFFKKLDWIIDYNSLKDLSEEELIKKGQEITQTKNEIAKQFNSMSEEERNKNLNMIEQCGLLEFKMISLRDYIWYKQGILKMSLPEEIAQDEENETGIKRLINKILKKRKM